MSRFAIVTLLFLTAGATPAAAQSLFSTRGLGVPVAPVDARARSLGGIGVGLLGVNMSLVNPASIAGIYGRGIVAGMEPTTHRVELDGEEGRGTSTRFPLVHMLSPVGTRLVAGIGYGGFLDQNWQVTSNGTEVIGGDTLATEDRFEAEGGISQIRFSLAYHATASLAVGAAAGLYTGRVDHSVTRTFSPVDPDTSAADGDTGPDLDPFRNRVERDFTGPTAAVGLRWDPASFVRMGASVGWNGELDADAEDDAVTDRALQMPWQATAGASIELGPRLMAALSGQWTGWNSLDREGFDEEDIAGDTWRLGGGFELQGPQLGQRAVPVRLGFRYAQLPFKLDGRTPSEWAAGLGVGLRLAGNPSMPAALIDAGLERGERGAGAPSGPDEEFWRLTLSLALFGL